MGGLALKNTHTRRYSRAEFDSLWIEMSATLAKTFSKFDYPRFYHKKESFGDMDIILSMDGFNRNMKEYIEETFQPNEIFHNGNAWSFDYKELQIDFITCAPEDYDSNYHYLAFNDLGNFMGRIAQKMGLKYGQEGLWYNHFHNGQKVGRIPVSKDYPRIFDYLDLSYDKWLEGFDTLEEIFEYVMGSKYFSPDQFQLDQLNKINRERNAKRKSYMSFLEYVEGMEPNEIGKILMEAHKEDLINKVAKAFPECDIKLEVKRIEYEDALRGYASAKFNGGMVMRELGLQGKDLGEAMSAFKDLIETKFGEYNTAIINMSETELWGLFNLSLETMGDPK
jgi:hypothetical protein